LKHPKVLVPDAGNRAALAVVRSLGRHGVPVVAGVSSRWALGGASRYAVVTRHPDPRTDPDGFARAVAGCVRDLGIGAIMPTSDTATYALLARLDELPSGARLVAPDPSSLAIAHDKAALVELAAKVGVPVPDGFVTSGDPSDDPRLDSLGFPVILKPSASRFFEGGVWHGATVRVAEDRRQIREICRERGFENRSFLVQRRVPGEGRGLFALASKGNVSAVFAHRRLREKPPWGGVSTLCESAEPEPELRDYAERLLSALGWTGVAMVEFKWDPSSRRGWLMEINGRFWGSLQLAVASGVDFPWLAYRQEVLGEAIETMCPSKRVRLWWILGDMDQAFIRLSRGGFREIPELLRDLAKTRGGAQLDLDTWAWNDPLPLLYELAERFSP